MASYLATLLAAGMLLSHAEAAAPTVKTGRLVIKLKAQPNLPRLLAISDGLGAQYIRGGTRSPYVLVQPKRAAFRIPKAMRSLVAWIEPEVDMSAVARTPPPVPAPRMYLARRDRIGTPAFGSRARPPRALQLVPAVPNDPLYRYQWGLQETGYGIRLSGARPLSQGAGVIVGIIDSGVRQDLSDLSRVDFLPGYNAITGTPGGSDDNGHGTHVCGTIAQSTNNGIGCAGIAPSARILSVKALDANGKGSNFTIGSGLRYAVDHGAQVINMSIGGVSSRTLQDAVQYAVAHGVTLCCATGNSGAGQITYPARYPGVIAVGALNAQGQRASFSQYGSGLSLVAPGEDILQQTFSRKTGKAGYYYYSGTSMATPHVTGVAALVKSLAPKISPADLKKLLMDTARDVGAAGYDPLTGAGRLDASAACERARGRAGSGPSVPLPVPAEPPAEPLPPAEPAPVTDPILAETLARFNAERANAGLPAVVMNEALCRAAAAHAQEMATRGVLTHTGADGSNPGDRISRTGYRWRTWGEIVGQGQRTPAAVVQAWMDSPGHRAIILGNFREVGVAKAGDYWCADWGSR
jgi:serine protease